MASMGRCLAAVVLVFALGSCKKSDGTSTAPSSGGGEEGAAASGGGASAGAGDQPAGAGGDEAGAEAGGGGGPMGPEEFCRSYGDKAQKEGGKAADFWERNYGKNCVKRLTAEKKKKGDEKWSEFVNCATAQPTAAEAFDACEL